VEEQAALNPSDRLASPHPTEQYLAVRVVPREAIMGRMSIDCREYPSDMNCTVAISADTKKELVDAAVQHAVAVHGHQDTPELREQIGGMIKSDG
jgi:predicted small metal-binding protein